MAYVIQVNYSTGDSGGNWDTECSLYYYDKSGNKTVYIEFENTEIAKENLRRIREHYEWAKSYSRFAWDKKYLPVPEYVLRFFPNCIKTSKYARKEYRELEFDSIYYIPIKLDDGSEVLCTASWNGCFEQLKSARITKKEEDGWSFEL